MESRLVGDEPVTADVLRDQVDANRYARDRDPRQGHPRLGKEPNGSVIRATATGENGEKVTVEEPATTVSPRGRPDRC